MFYWTLEYLEYGIKIESLSDRCFLTPSVKLTAGLT